MGKGSQNPEGLHDVGQDTGNKTTASFVNPGTPTSGFVQMSQRKHARIEGANQAALKAKGTSPNNV